MNTQKPLLYTFAFTMTILLLSGCAASATTSTSIPLPPSQTATPPLPTQPPSTPTATLPPVCQSLESQETSSDLSGREVVSAMVERLNDSDVPGAMAYFAEDARAYIIGLPPIGFESFRGKEAICRTWAEDVSDNFEWELTILSALNSSNGTLIFAKSKTWLDFYRQLEVAPNEFYDSFIVEDGKITEYAATLKPESLAQLRSVLSPEPTPDTSSETPGLEFSVMFSDLTCTYEGPAVLKSGKVDVKGEVNDQEMSYGYALMIVTIDESRDFFDLAVVSGGDAPYWVRYTPYDFGPGERKTYEYTAGGMPLYLMCFAEKPTTNPIGLFGPIEVRP
jgi:hypothetical protein